MIIEQAASGEGDGTPAPTIIHSVQRTGCMAAFESFNQFESYFDEILDLIEDFSSTATVSPKIMEAVESGSESQSTSINVSLSVDAPPRSSRDEHHIQVSYNYCVDEIFNCWNLIYMEFSLKKKIIFTILFFILFATSNCLMKWTSFDVFFFCFFFKKMKGAGVTIVSE